MPRQLNNQSTSELIQRFQQLQADASPLWGKYYRALYRNFIKPVGSQESMAEGLKMSFSTYRRYVKSGLEVVIDLLWKKEVVG